MDFISDKTLHFNIHLSHLNYIYRPEHSGQLIKKMYSLASFETVTSLEKRNNRLIRPDLNRSNRTKIKINYFIRNNFDYVSYTQIKCKNILTCDYTGSDNCPRTKIHVCSNPDGEIIIYTKSLKCAGC